MHGQGASNINCSTLVFIFAVIAAFQNQSPILPMATNMQVSKDIPVFCVAVLPKQGRSQDFSRGTHNSPNPLLFLQSPKSAVPS